MMIKANTLNMGLFKKKDLQCKKNKSKVFMVWKWFCCVCEHETVDIYLK